jgi:hypothetical protein
MQGWAKGVVWLIFAWVVAKSTDSEIIDFALNSLFVHLHTIVQGLSTPGNGEGGSEQIHVGAQNKNLPVRHVLFWNDRRPR